MARPEDPKDLVRMYREAQTLRQPYEHDYRMASAFCYPRHYAGWQSGGTATQLLHTVDPRLAYDTTGIRSLPKFRAIITRIMTPQTQRYLAAEASATNKYLMKINAVRQYFQEVTNRIFAVRADPHSRFVVAQDELYVCLGLYGAGPKYVEWEKPNPMRPRGGMLYRSVHMRNMYWHVDDAGRVSGWFRRCNWTARQFEMKFKGKSKPKLVADELAKPGGPSEQRYFEFFHYVCLQSNYDKGALNYKSYRFESSYVFVEQPEYVGEAEGLLTQGYITPRTLSEPEDIYGDSPAMRALPALGGASAMRKIMLKQGQKAVDPPLLAGDDGVLSGKVDIRPAAVNYGAVTPAGDRLVYPLETGRFEPIAELLQDERRDIEDNFLVTLFQLVAEREMTVPEVLERIGEQASLLAPWMARLQVEDQGPQVDAEIVYLSQYGQLPPMPPELVEAQGEYEVVYTSPMAKAMQQEDVSGFVRWVNFGTEYANQTQDPSPLDYINFDEAYPDVGRVMSVRENWIATPEQVAAKREQRTQQQETQQAIEAAPAVAGIVSTAMKTRQPAKVGSEPG